MWITPGFCSGFWESGKASDGQQLSILQRLQELIQKYMMHGANKIQSILHITIPGIMPTYVVMFLLAVSNILSNGFDQYFMFYNPMVADKIEVLDYYVYKVGFYINDYSYSITLGMLKSILGIVLLFTANALSKKIRGESIV